MSKEIKMKMLYNIKKDIIIDPFLENILNQCGIEVKPVSSCECGTIYYKKEDKFLNGVELYYKGERILLVELGKKFYKLVGFIKGDSIYKVIEIQETKDNKRTYRIIGNKKIELISTNFDSVKDLEELNQVELYIDYNLCEYGITISKDDFGQVYIWIKIDNYNRSIKLKPGSGKKELDEFINNLLSSEELTGKNQKSGEIIRLLLSHSKIQEYLNKVVNSIPMSYNDGYIRALEKLRDERDKQIDKIMSKYVKNKQNLVQQLERLDNGNKEQDTEDKPPRRTRKKDTKKKEG